MPCVINHMWGEVILCIFQFLNDSSNFSIMKSEMIIPEYVLLGQKGTTVLSGFMGATMTVYTSPHVTSDTSHMLSPGAGLQVWARLPPVTWAVKLLRELEDHHETRRVLLKRV